MPAYWWMYNMYALLRNEVKFTSRDKRYLKTQHVEFSAFAPDTAEEMFQALELLELQVGRAGTPSRAKPLPKRARRAPKAANS
jgi:hypothetical protein